MKNSSALSCEHIRVKCVPGRTDAFVRALQGYILELFALSDEFGSAEIKIRNDEKTYKFEWLDKEVPTSNMGAIDEMATASSIDIRIDMCCDLFMMDDAQRSLALLLKDGSLKDLVFYSILMEDEHTSSLSMSGIYRGAFLHGAVPFTMGNEAILLSSVWNGYTHSAQFTISTEDEQRLDALNDVADALEEQIDEISVSRAPSDSALHISIDSPQLKTLEEIELYRSMLEKLTQLSNTTQIIGAFTPENDDVFALMRFVQVGKAVQLETAVAEEYKH